MGTGFLWLNLIAFHPRTYELFPRLRGAAWRGLCLSAIQSKIEQSAKHAPGKAASIFLDVVQQKTNVGGQSACETRQSITQNGASPLPISLSMLWLHLASASSAPNPAESWKMLQLLLMGLCSSCMMICFWMHPKGRVSGSKWQDQPWYKISRILL